MIPELWNKLGTEKIGDLNDCLECFVEEERNGIFELTLDFPNGYPLADQLLKEKIIIANANDTLLKQKFRIYDTKKFINETITVFARHISFDLMYDYVDNVTFENQSCEYALNSLFRQSQFSKHYRGYSDIVNAQNYSMSMCNILEAIGGKEGSIIDTFGTGAEILRDNTDVHVLNARGHDNCVTIEYGKNLTGFELSEDTTNLVTRILPYAKYTPEGGKETLVRGSFVDSPLIDSYSHPYIKHIDYTDKFKDKEIPTKEKLETLARNEYRDNKVDIPKTNFKIEFIPLSKCVGYEELEDKISICDKVTIKNIRYNVDTKAKVIKYKFDVLKDRYESMELGEPRTTFGNIIGNGSGDGQVGPQGPPGPPGADGNIGDFPNSLPQTPILTTKVYGFSTIELSWTFEDKIYYTYELYASKEKDFKPNTFDLIHSGQSSSFLFQAKPNETWYFRVCAKNTHGERTDFSPQVVVNTVKEDSLGNYFTDMAIGKAVAGSLTADYMEAGIIKANWVEFKGASIVDGNGKRTLDIDSFGNIDLDVNKLSIRSKSVATNETVTNIKQDLSSQIGGVSSKVERIESDYVTSSTVTQLDDSWTAKFKSTGYNVLRNTSFKKEMDYWGVSGDPNLGEVGILDYSSHFAFKDENVKTIQIFMQNKHATEFGIKQSVNLTVGQVYTIGFYANGIDCGWGNIIIEKHGIVEHVQHFNPLENGGGFNKWVKVSYSFEATTEAYTIKIVLRDAGNSGHMWIAKPILCEGLIDKVWTPNPNEIYDGIIRLDEKGMKISHSDGSKGEYDSEGITYYDSNNIKTSAIYDGKFSTIDDKGNVIGYTGKSIWKGTDTYLTALEAIYGSTVGMGTQISGNGDVLIPLVVASKGMLIGDTWLQQGLNIINPRTFGKQTFFRRNIGIESVTMEQFADDNDYGVVVGSNGVNIGVIHDNQPHIGFCIEKNLDYYSKCIIQAHTDLNMNNFSILNANISTTLSDTKTLSLEEQMTQDQAYVSYSTTAGEVRWSDRQNHNTVATGHGTYESFINIPENISNNINFEAGYHINITKLTFGDYRVKEKGQNYFILESEKENFYFTFEIVAKLSKVK